ncbi:Oxygen-regulated invasion protein OrgB [Chromobacterium violaceum]|uniref:Oxygen-regulated invasion protein OrgB n=1 Tax=Chromobacterium violaceum TaxID=536 RepID=A0A447TDW2_CHRVL|nr:Oxygen-regulated invasion protein OrgB [Chromobacterium violaceum]
MPRDIPIFRPPNAIEGVLVCREQLLRHDKAVSLEREARRHAARIVRQAEQEAESLRGRALLDGYGDGMIQALGQLARHLANGDALLRHCRERLEAESRRCCPLRSTTRTPCCWPWTNGCGAAEGG